VPPPEKQTALPEKVKYRFMALIFAIHTVRSTASVRLGGSWNFYPVERGKMTVELGLHNNSPQSAIASTLSESILIC
jgi:hypothetical protein